MANVHVHLHVSNLDASRAFYQRFLGGEPVKVKPEDHEAPAPSTTCCTPLGRISLGKRA